MLNPIYISSSGFKPSFSTNVKDFTKLNSNDAQNGLCVWWHEEPLNKIDLDNIRHFRFPKNSSWGSVSAEYDQTISIAPPTQPPCFLFLVDANFYIFANSEKSKFKTQYLKEWQMYDWYFFYHGFAALDWFRDFKYFDYSNKTQHFDKVFICLNHLITKKRSYRLHLISQLQSKNIESYGFLSAPLLDKNQIKKELYSPDSMLSVDAKKHIFKNLLPNAKPLILDECNYNDASADIIDKKYVLNSLWNVVTETVFYDDSLHLTEKIFKPIVTKRPFILVGAPGNLAYLKSYGFRTFDKWIDESYDQETDPDKRINMIVNEIEKLCRLSKEDLQKMYQELIPTLEYNHSYFFTEFKEVIVNELVDNFEKCVKRYNNDLSARWQLPASNINFSQIKSILLN